MAVTAFAVLIARTTQFVILNQNHVSAVSLLNPAGRLPDAVEWVGPFSIERGDTRCQVLTDCSVAEDKLSAGVALKCFRTTSGESEMSAYS
jgi:hypothetical protein